MVRIGQRGYWIQGKLGIATLAGLLQDLCQRSGLSEDCLILVELNDKLDYNISGVVITNPQPIRKTIEQLQLFYDFFTIEDADRISFKLKNALEIKQVDATNLLPVNSEAGLELLNIQRA
ncbi:MAG: hypothetical protein MRQ07_02770 [Candidatus Midichloria sp.]|nr:hypothetical protein [Candidatus Midichloria sp.]